MRWLRAYADGAPLADVIDLSDIGDRTMLPSKPAGQTSRADQPSNQPARLEFQPRNCLEGRGDY